MKEKLSEEQKLLKDYKDVIDYRRNLPENELAPVDEKWGLPAGYERHYLTRPDMSDQDILTAFGMEYDEEDIMNKFCNKKAVYVREIENGKRIVGVDFLWNKRKTIFVPVLSPTLLMFVAMHLEERLAMEEVYGNGYFERFCEEYYDEQNDVFKNIFPANVWEKAAKDARQQMIEKYCAKERE